MEKRKIIFDCDPGHDDIMAIMNALAHPEQLEILGYTTVCGNNYVDKVTRNLCQVFDAKCLCIFNKIRMFLLKSCNCFYNLRYFLPNTKISC